MGRVSPDQPPRPNIRPPQADSTAHSRLSNHTAELAIDGDAVWVALRYLDEYARTASGWCFRERDVKMLYLMRLSELPTMMGDRLRKRWPGTDPEPADFGCDVL